MGGQQLLDEASLLAEAEGACGLSDWGSDQRFRVSLGVLVHALNRTKLPPGLSERAHGHLLGLLIQRLGLVDDEKSHPDVVRIPIERPLIVLGMPRSGTTILYDLLASAPDVRAPLTWEASNVWPAAADWEADPRISEVQQGIDAMLQVSPQIANMIPVGATLPAECNALMMHHFAGPDFGAFYGVAEHSRWVARETVPGLYATHRRILQQLSWRRPAGRWVLKSPIHLYDIPSLLQTYPDAGLVWTHRDPYRVFPSLVGLLAATQRSAGFTPDPIALGAQTLENYGALLDRGLAARKDPAVDKHILDVPFRDVQARPVDTVRLVHDHFGFSFDADHRRRIEYFLGEHPPGSNVQRAEDYGFDESLFRRRFAAYYERFGHLL